MSFRAFWALKCLFCKASFVLSKTNFSAGVDLNKLHWLETRKSTITMHCTHMKHCMVLRRSNSVWKNYLLKISDNFGGVWLDARTQPGLTHWCAVIFDSCQRRKWILVKVGDHGSVRYSISAIPTLGNVDSNIPPCALNSPFICATLVTMSPSLIRSMNSRNSLTKDSSMSAG